MVKLYMNIELVVAMMNRLLAVFLASGLRRGKFGFMVDSTGTLCDTVTAVYPSISTGCYLRRWS
jgi:division protein CdvB (Snf7/Vps24/ESCRT-III family)